MAQVQLWQGESRWHNATWNSSKTINMEQRNWVDGTRPPCFQIGGFQCVKTRSIVDGASASFNFFGAIYVFFFAKIMKNVKQRCPVDGASGGFMPSIQYFLEGNHASQSRWRKCHLKMCFWMTGFLLFFLPPCGGTLGSRRVVLGRWQVGLEMWANAE